jgi:hypothetical protein
MKAARAAAEAGIDGLAFLRGIPGSIGGALRMNAGAHGGETTDVLIEARGMDRTGAIRTFTHDEMGFSYRHSEAPEDVIFTSALFQGRPGEPAAILVRAAVPLEGLEQMRLHRGVSDERKLLSGPGKLAKAFGITGTDNGVDLFATSEGGLHLIPPMEVVTNIVAGPRIGIAEGKWHDVPWRFVDGDEAKWIS